MDTEQLIDAMPIRWGCAPPGLRIGGDSVVDVFMSVDAAAVWAVFGEGPPPETGVGNANGLRNVSLRISVPGHASVTPLSLLEGEHRQWALPDLSWTDHVHAAFRIIWQPGRLPANEQLVCLARVRLTADSVNEDGADASTVVCSQELSLPLLGEEGWREIPGDPEAAALIDRLRGRPAQVVGLESVHDVPERR